MAVKAVFFDVGETLANEFRSWGELARLVGLEPHVIWAGLGALIERGRTHSEVFELLGVDYPGDDAVGWEAADFYPDAKPCLSANWVASGEHLPPVERR